MERTKKTGEEIPKKDENPVDTPADEIQPTEGEKVPEEEKVKEEIPEYVDPDPIILWKKLGGGSLHLSKRLIPPGATFKARQSEIPKAFRDLVQPLEKLPTVPETPEVKPVKSVYQVVPRGKSKSPFDVIGPNGKKMNEQPLSKAVAERLIIDLA